MAELKNRQWLLAARPQGLIKESDFRWNETAVPPLADGQLLVRNLALSFDPTQRGWMSMDTYIPAIPLGQVMKAVVPNHASLVILTRSSAFLRLYSLAASGRIPS